MKVKNFWDSPAWRRLRRTVLRRDKYICRRCLRHYPYGRGLTVHHIIPRPKGATIETNLISLCPKCHDFVEMSGLYAVKEIVQKTVLDDIVAPPPVAVENVHDWRDIDWRIRVYGGVKNFDAAKTIMAENEKRNCT